MTSSIFDQSAFNAALFHPRADVAPPPPGAHDSFVDVHGARLHVRTHAAVASTLPALLLFHGNGEVVADYDAAAEQFARAGVSLIVADYRGYGASTGTPSLRQLIEDARIVAEAVRPMFVMGRSLGGAAAHELFARPVGSMCGVVLESAFCDLGALIRRRGLEPPCAYEPDELAVFSPAEKLRRGTLPLLVMHGARDSLIIPDEARLAYDAAGSSSKSLAFIPGRGHNDLALAPTYWTQLALFVDHVRGLPRP